MENQIPKAAYPVPPLQLAAYLLTFAIPMAVAMILLPAYTSWIILGGYALCIAVSSFLIGWQWDDPKWTPQARGAIRAAVYLLTLAALAPQIWGVFNGLWEETIFAAAIVGTAIGLPLIMVLPFHAGRGMHRRKISRA